MCVCVYDVCVCVLTGAALGLLMAKTPQGTAGAWAGNVPLPGVARVLSAEAV